MAGLPQLGSLRKAVTVRGSTVDVRGVSARGIMQLLNRFPEFQSLIGGRAPQQITGETIIQLVPDAVCAIIAIGLGANEPDAQREAEAWADELGAEEQLDLLTAILSLTMPSGFGPFAQKLQALLPGLDEVAALGEAAESGKAPATKSEQPSSSA